MIVSALAAAAIAAAPFAGSPLKLEPAAGNVRISTDPPRPTLSLTATGEMRLTECDGSEVVVGRFDVTKPPVGSWGPSVPTDENSYHANPDASPEVQAKAMTLLMIAAARGKWPACRSNSR